MNLFDVFLHHWLDVLNKRRQLLTPMQDRQAITLRVDPETKRKLEEAAAKDHRSVSAQCVFFLSRAVEQMQTIADEAPASR